MRVYTRMDAYLRLNPTARIRAVRARLREAKRRYGRGSSGRRARPDCCGDLASGIFAAQR